MFRATGEAVLIDYGLSHHNQLPDLLQEEFRVPFGTAPYMAPERLLGMRDDPRSDMFSLGVLLYFFTTGERPFGESRDHARHAAAAVARSASAAQARPDYPPWLQEIVLRCLEIEPALALSDRLAARFRSRPSRPGQVDGACRTAGPRSALDGMAPPLQPRHHAAEAEVRYRSPAGVGPDRRGRARYRGRFRTNSMRRCASPPSASWRRCRRRGWPASTC